MKDLDYILSHFESPKQIRTAKGCKQTYQTRCPCSTHSHGDRKPSLTISEALNGKILMCCHAGDKFEDIATAAGLELDDLRQDSNPSTWKNRLAQFYSKKYGDGVKVIAEYPYYDGKGHYLYSKVRLEGGRIDGKLIRYFEIDHAADTYRNHKVVDSYSLYRLPEFLKLKGKSQYVYIVEGEKDCETLRKLKNGFGCVTTAGGVQDWRKEYARYFKGLNVIILRDNDSAGEKNAQIITQDLKNYAHYIKIVNPSRLEKGDVTDYLTKEGGTAQSLKDLCSSVTEVTFAKWVKIDDKGHECGVNTGILAEAIAENETYIIVRNPYEDKDFFYMYVDGVYELVNKPRIKAMIREYVPAANVTDNMLNNVCNLLFATSENIHKIDELDSDSRFINLKNGLYDIKAKKLLPHDHKVLSTIQLPFNYESGSSPTTVFDKYINDLCTKSDGSIDQNEIMIIQEYMGFILSNEPMSKIKTTLVLWSRLGNSGKSVFLRLITKFVGLERVASIKLTELTPDNRFILGFLPNCRVIMCGDESNSNVTDSSTFKSITGGDSVKIEAKGKQGYSYIYKGGFLIACNGLPCFVDDKGNHLYNRLMILPCEHHITDEMKDTKLDDKLSQELPGIFKWALDGLYRLIDNGYVFTKSRSSEAAKLEYHKAMDNVYRFIDEWYTITKDYSDKVSATEFKDSYHRWCCMDNTIKEVDRKNLDARLESFGITTDKNTIGDQHGIMVYRGLKRKEPEFVDSYYDSYYDPFNNIVASKT